MIHQFLDRLPDAQEVLFTFGRRGKDRRANNYVIYCRESDERRDSNASIPAQLTQCRQLADRLGLNVLGVIREKKSARNPGERERPKFTNLVRAIRGEEDLVCTEERLQKPSRPDGIIAWHPDRLARNWTDAGEIIELLDRERLSDMQFVMYAFHNDSSGKEHLAMEFARAKGYSDHLQDNVMRGTIDKEVKGKGTHPLPPAFDALQDSDSPDHLKIVPSSLHEYWRSVYRWRLENKTFEVIAKMLVEAGYKDTQKYAGKMRVVNIDHKYVSKHIKNPLHCGWLVTKRGKEPRRVDLTSIFPQEYGHPFPAVVTLEEFRKVNPELFSDTSAKPAEGRKRSEYPLAGKVLCKLRLDQKLHPCTMFANSPKGGSGLPSPRYSCARCETSHSVRMEVVQKAAEKELKKIVMTEREHKKFVVTEWERYRNDREMLKATRREIGTLKGQNEKEVEEAEETLNRMEYGKPKATRERIRVQKKLLERLHEEQRSLIKREEKNAEEGIRRYFDLRAFLELSKNGSRWWRKANDPEKRLMAEVLISNVVVDMQGKATASLTPHFAELSSDSKGKSGRDERT